jgi:hypothetical protein
MLYPKIQKSVETRRLSPLSQLRTLRRISIGVASTALLTSITFAGQGGGVASSGFKGEYFANSNFAGSPTFTRRDVRIDFDWRGLTPGGSPAKPFGDVPANNFSVRWSGQLVPRFSETYTFVSTANEGIQVRISPASQNQWTNIIDHLSTNNDVATTTSGNYSFTRGQRYDIEVNYRQLGGQAIAKLHWQSANTPREAIDPVKEVVAHSSDFGDSSQYVQFANVFKGNRGPIDLNTGETAAVDSNGWPAKDFAYLWWDGNYVNFPNPAGTYELSFKGQADLSLDLVEGRIENKQYDAATNTTRASVTITQTTQTNPKMVFKNTRRTNGGALSQGLTEVKLMRPIVGGNGNYDTSTIFTNEYREALSYFSAIRMLSIDGYGTDNNGVWANRRVPGYGSQAFTPNAEAVHEAGSLEYMIVMANETGKDIWLNIPIKANEDYMRRAAQMIAFGSDGVNPYSSPQVNPVYPPLNSNLRAYVEYGNEIWNYAFNYGGEWNENAAVAEVLRGNSTLNYDNLDFQLDEKGKYRNRYIWSARRVIHEGKKMSEIFRSVFGNESMMSRIRPVYMYQYDGYGTAAPALAFMNGYFNNARGNYVSNPKPLSYYFYAAGAATYFNANNAAAGSIDGIFASGIPENTYGATLKAEAAWARAYGLPYLAYEGGWSVSRTDTFFGSVTVSMRQAKYDPRARDAHLRAQEVFERVGGEMNANLNIIGWDRGDYDAWTMSPSVYRLDTPLWQAHKELIERLPAEIDAFPSTSNVVQGNNSLEGRFSSGTLYNFRDPLAGYSIEGLYVVNAPSAGNFALTVNASQGSRGIASVYVNGKSVGNVDLTAGSPALNITLQRGLNGVILLPRTGTEAGIASLKFTSSGSTPPSSTDTQTIGASDDRDTWPGNPANHPTINASLWQDAYVKFSLASSGNTVESATLRLYRADANLGQSSFVLHEVSDIGWNESNTNFPTYASPIATQTSSGIGWVEFDVSAFVGSNRSSGSVTFAVRSDKDNWTSFYSKDSNAGEKPELVVRSR